MEDFFSLVESGVVPPPDKDLLSKCVFPSSARQQPPAPQQSGVAFAGIGKPSAIVQNATAAAAAASSPGGNGAGAKRARGGNGNGNGNGSAAKQAKTEG